MKVKVIDADKLKELIDEKWKELADENVKVGGGKWDAEISTYLSVLGLIDSLQRERPAADLEEEIAVYLRTFSSSFENGIEYAKNIARHFYELGLKAGKEE